MTHEVNIGKLFIELGDFADWELHYDANISYNEAIVPYISKSTLEEFNTIYEKMVEELLDNVLNGDTVTEIRDEIGNEKENGGM